MYEKYAELRDKRGVTDYAVSKACGIGRSTFSEWKSGKYQPKPEKLKKIAEYLGVSLEYFYGDSDRVQNNGQQEHYYLDDDARELAEFLHKNPDYKVLFDASRSVAPEDIDFVRQMIERMGGKD